MKYLFTILSLPLMLSTSSKAKAQALDSLNHVLDEIVVVGTGTEHKLKDAPVQTEVISSKQLKQFNGSSLEDILSMLSPSFDFQSSDMGSNMQLGGLSNSYILVLVDGKRMHGDLGGQNNLGQIDPARIDRIEIIKGAASALYGSDAIAGVINIILKKNRDNFLVENTTRIGSHWETRQSDRIQFKVGNVYSQTNFQLKHTDGWQNTTLENPNRYEKPVTNSINKTVNEFTDWGIDQRLDWNINDQTSLYAEGGWYTKKIYRPCGVPDYKTYNFIYRDIDAKAGGKIKYGDKNNFTWDVMYNSHAYHYDYTHETWETVRDGEGNRITIPHFPGDEALQSRQERIIAQAKNIIYLPYGNILSTGIEERYDRLKSPNRLDNKTADDNTMSAFVQDEWNLIKNFNVTAGLRLTYTNSFGTHLSPKLSAMYKLGDFRFRAGYSEGFKTPTLKELHYRYIRQMSLISLNLGNQDLDPQTSRYLTAGIEYNGKDFSFSVTGYYNKLNNMITLVTVPRSEAPSDLLVTYDPARVRMYKNMDKAETAGVDVNLKYSPLKSLSFTAGYSYLYTDADMYNDKEETIENVIIDGTAKHRGTLSGVWNHRFTSLYKLAVGVYGRMQSKRYYQEDGDGKAYNLWKLNTSHNLTVGKFWKFNINAGIDNIFDYKETTYHGLHYGTTTSGRTFYVSVNVSFGKKNKKL